MKLTPWMAVAALLWGGDRAQGQPPEPVAARVVHKADVAGVQEKFSGAREQVIVARSGFSPGLIDGKPGRKTKLAIEQLQRAKGLEVTGKMDEATVAALGESDAVAAGKSAWVRAYTITEEDVALVTGPIPEDWNERAKLERSGYADLEECLAERGWCAVELVRVLNPRVEINALVAGDERVDAALTG